MVASLRNACPAALSGQRDTTHPTSLLAAPAVDFASRKDKPNPTAVFVRRACTRYTRSGAGRTRPARGPPVVAAAATAFAASAAVAVAAAAAVAVVVVAMAAAGKRPSGAGRGCGADATLTVTSSSPPSSTGSHVGRPRRFSVASTSSSTTTNPSSTPASGTAPAAPAADAISREEEEAPCVAAVAPAAVGPARAPTPS
jgi:hypothetical protein